MLFRSAFQYADDFYYLHKGHVHNADNPSIPDLQLLEAIYNMEFASVSKGDKEFILPLWVSN